MCLLDILIYFLKTSYQTLVCFSYSSVFLLNYETSLHILEESLSDAVVV